MHKYANKNIINKRKVLMSLPTEIHNILAQNIYANGIVEDDILYAGVVVAKKKNTILPFLLLIICVSLLNSLVIQAIGGPLGAFVLVTIIFFGRRVLLDNERYYLFVLKDEIDLIPIKNPDLYIRLPQEYINRISISAKWSGYVKFETAYKLYEDYPKEQERFQILQKSFKTETGIVRQLSGSIFNITHALLQSDFSRVLISAEKLRD